MKKRKTKKLLIINTVIHGKIFVAVAMSDKFYKKIKSAGKSDNLFLRINEILEKTKLKLKDLSGIIVVSGPGSFTAVRQGVVVANTLGYVLRIPVVSIRLNEFQSEKELLEKSLERIEKGKVGEFILPFYGQEPNITKSKQ